MSQTGFPEINFPRSGNLSMLFSSIRFGCMKIGDRLLLGEVLSVVKREIFSLINSEKLTYLLLKLLLHHRK